MVYVEESGEDKGNGGLGEELFHIKRRGKIPWVLAKMVLYSNQDLIHYTS